MLLSWRKVLRESNQIVEGHVQNANQACYRLDGRIALWVPAEFFDGLKINP
jgi:hypothetical protein